MQSLKSNALEPTRPELAGLTRRQAAVRILPVYGLPILTLVLAVFFSVLLKLFDFDHHGVLPRLLRRRSWPPDTPCIYCDAQ